MLTLEAVRITELPSTNSGSAFCTVKSTPFTLRPNVSSYCSSVIDPKGIIEPPAGIDEQHIDATCLGLHAIIETIEIAEIGGIRLDAGGLRPNRRNGGVELGSATAGHKDLRAFRCET